MALIVAPSAHHPARLERSAAPIGACARLPRLGAQVVQRVDSMLLFLNRRYSGKRCIAVCHGETMWAFRLRFEQLTSLKYRALQANPKLEDRIHNCQVRPLAHSSLTAATRAHGRGDRAAVPASAPHDPP